MSSRRLQDMSSRHLQDMSSRRLQDMSSRRLQDMSSRRLQDVFSLTIFRLPGRLQDVLQDVFKTSVQAGIHGESHMNTYQGEETSHNFN